LDVCIEKCLCYKLT